MSTQGDIHAALMGRVETLSGFDVVWPRIGQDIPSGEHIRASVVPNDDQRTFISNDRTEARGFLVLTLVSSLDNYQVESERKAGEIKDHFPLGYTFTHNGTSLKCMNRSVRVARQEDGRWETPIWIEYRGFVAS